MDRTQHIKDALTILNKVFATELARINEANADDAWSTSSIAEDYLDLLGPYLEASAALRQALNGGAK